MRPPLHVGCKVDDCDRKHQARGYCNLHYKRVLVYGMTEDAPPPPSIHAAADRLEDCHWMADTGEGLTNAAARLGLTKNALDRWLRDHDRDCLARLIRQEPKDHNRSPDAGITIYELTGLGDRRRKRKARAA